MPSVTDICRMKILLLSATTFEIGPAISFLEERNGLYQDNEISVLTGGVGLLSTAYELTRELYRSRPDFVLQAGIAGSFRTDIALSKAVLVKEESVADMGVMENDVFQSLFDMKLVNGTGFPYTAGKLVNPDIARWDFLGLQQVAGISVNEITTDPVRAKEWKKKYSADVESMEGAALHFICLQENIPFLQIRTISNRVGERDKSKWKMKEAIKELNECVLAVIGKM